jgi:hypothetical protein
MSSFCRCPQPRRNDRRPDFCRRCGVRHNPRIVSSDDNIRIFFARLAELPGVNAAALLEARDRVREADGIQHIGRENAADGCQSAADGLIDAAYEWLNDRRTGEEDIDPDLIDAAHHFAQAHAALKRRKWGR